MSFLVRKSADIAYLCTKIDAYDYKKLDKSFAEAKAELTKKKD